MNVCARSYVVAMEQLNISLRNCHGIRQLDAELAFGDRNSVAIYAPNGTMKSSFARTLADYSRGEASKDHVFPDRVTVREITDEAGHEPDPSSIAVFLAYDDQYASTEFASTLLVNAELRKQYEAISKELTSLQEQLTKALKKQARTKVDVATLVSQLFTQQDDNFFGALTRVAYEVEQLEDPPFADLPYDLLFNSNTEKILNDPNLQGVLAEYVTRLNELLDSSTFFSRAKFSYYNAETVNKSLTSQGFFDASHSLLLAGGAEPKKVSSQAELESLIAEEKQRITEDPELRERLSALERVVTVNQANRDFFDFISERPELLPNFANINLFKERIWTSYFKACEDLFNQAVDSHKASEEQRKEILRQAAAESTHWERVIALFNARFVVPFKLIARNREKVMLGQEAHLTLDFEFHDGGTPARVEREHLLRVLSTGEKKAFYILNVLFEVEARRLGPGRETTFVFDDIADSFDYKNKYAIIQYLKDIAEHEQFRLVILTHNFDFLRTIFSRGVVTYGGCFMSEKAADRLTLTPMEGSDITNPFANDFKAKLFTDGMKRAASVPFVRNLLEYSRGKKDEGYLKLTSLIHWKSESATITQAELDRILTATLPELAGQSWADQDQPVIEMFYAEAERALRAAEGVNFANKIVLSIAIRLRAEDFMVTALNDPALTESIASSQTWKLYKALKDRDLANEETLVTLRTVLLMTPENIHINSFMYEPIIDMSDAALRELYQDVKNLATPTPASTVSVGA